MSETSRTTRPRGAAAHSRCVATDRQATDVLDYLAARAKRNPIGKVSVRAKEIGRETDVSVHVIGHAVNRIVDDNDDAALPGRKGITVEIDDSAAKRRYIARTIRPVDRDRSNSAGSQP